MGSKVNSNKAPEFRYALFRWCDVLALGVLSAVFWFFVFETSIPNFVFSWLSEQPTLIQCVLSALAALSIILIQQRFYARLRRVKDKCCIDWKALLYYPPLHISVAIGLVLFISTSNAVASQPLNSNSTLLITVFMFTYCALAMLKHPKPEKGKSIQASGHSLYSMSDEEFGTWIEKDDPTDPIDLLNRKPYLDRIVRRLTDSAPTKTTRGQIIYGPFGSGKSTLVESVFSELSDSHDEEWISCHFDCWGRTEDAETLTELLLEEVIDAIGQHVDASAIIGVPSEYVAAAYDAHPLFRIAAPFVRKRSRNTVLKDINTILKLNNLKLLLVIENIDRAQNVSLFAGVVGSVLDQIAALDSIRFLFTSDRHPDITPIASRLADHIEELSLSNIYKIIPRFIEYCIKQKADNIILPYRDQNGVIYQNRKNIHDKKFRSLYIAAASFIDNIRDLKLIFRNTLEMWRIHQGEIHILDILLYNLYKHSHRLTQEIDNIIFNRNGNEKHNPKKVVEHEILADRVDEGHIQNLAINSPEQSLAILRTYLLAQGAYSDKYAGINLSDKYGNNALESLRNGEKTEGSIQPFLRAVICLNVNNKSDLMQHYTPDDLISYSNDLNVIAYCYWHNNIEVAKKVWKRALTIEFTMSDENRLRFRSLAHDFVSSSAVITQNQLEDILRPALDILDESGRYEQAIILTQSVGKRYGLNIAAESFEYLISLKFQGFKEINLSICLADFICLFAERMNDQNQDQCLEQIRIIINLLISEIDRDKYWLKNYFRSVKSQGSLENGMQDLFSKIKDNSQLTPLEKNNIDKILTNVFPEKH